MDIRVKVQEIKIIEREYEVSGVTSLENAEKCVMRSIAHQFQPNVYMRREVPCKPEYKVTRYEVVKE